MMTAQEHQLVIEMFKNQTLVFAALVETLKSQEIVQQNDLDARDDLLTQSGMRDRIEQHVEETYRKFAKILGVTDLPLL